MLALLAVDLRHTPLHTDPAMQATVYFDLSKQTPKIEEVTAIRKPKLKKIEALPLSTASKKTEPRQLTPVNRIKREGYLRANEFTRKRRNVPVPEEDAELDLIGPPSKEEYALGFDPVAPIAVAQKNMRPPSAVSPSAEGELPEADIDLDG